MSRRLTEAAALAQRMFPPGAEVAACAIGAAPPPLPVEAAAVAMAVPSRKAEFAAGRAAARAALTALGLPPVAVPVTESRAPAWPPGIVGSITHADGLALAVLAPARQCAGLGLDAEPDAPLPDDVIDSITRPEERRWLATQPDPLAAARQIFVAKEAAYKCQFPASKAMLGFDAMRIGIAPDGGLEAEFVIDVPPFARGQRLKGRMMRGAGLVLAGFSRPVGRAIHG